MPRVKLTSYVNAGVCLGAPGDEIEITEENRSAVEALVKDRGAVLLRESLSKEPSSKSTVTAADSDGGSEDDDEGLADDLTADSPIESLKDYGISARYISALKDAKFVTIADVMIQQADLGKVPGISPKAAEAILKAIEKGLPKPE